MALPNEEAYVEKSGKRQGNHHEYKDILFGKGRECRQGWNLVGGGN